MELQNVPLKGKYLSEALMLASTNPKHDDKLFIELSVHYMKIPSSEHVENIMLRAWCVYINCSKCKNKIKKQFVNTTCSQHVLKMF